MNKFFLSLCTLAALLTGCNLFDNNQKVPTISVEKTITTKPTATKPFTEESLSTLMTAEFALYRGQFDLSLTIYVEQAQKTRDPQVIERAYQVASYLGNSKEQLNMALLWVKMAPEKIEANKAAAIELTKNERGQEASPYFEQVLAHTEQLDFLSLAGATLTQKARQEVLTSISQLLIKYPDKAQLIYTKTILLADLGSSTEALSTLQKLPTNLQKENHVVLLKVLLLQSTGKSSEALALLNQEIKNHPNNKKIRLNLAHRLISQGKLPEAKQQFLALHKQYPNDEEIPFALALICLEQQNWDEAISYLNTLLDHGTNPNTVHFYLGTAYNEKGNKDLALDHYKQVTAGDNYLAAIANTAQIFFEQGEIKQAQQLFIKTRKERPDLTTPLYLFEVEELQKANKVSEAWSTINQAIKTDPKNTSFLYSRALVAEQRNDLTQTEKDLRQAIRLDPKNDTIINALGYILADRTSRYTEALALIEQALKLNPDNPAILDSLGWVKYKLGDLVTAEKYLERAYQKYPDPDVAAHLGEVLWKKGEQQKAKDIWSKALTNDPKSKTLNETIKRLTGSKEL